MFFPFFPFSLEITLLLESFTRSDIYYASDLRSELFSLIKWIQFFSMSVFPQLESSNFLRRFFLFLWRDYREGLNLCHSRAVVVLSLIKEKNWNDNLRMKIFSVDRKKKFLVKFVSGNLTIFRNSSARKGKIEPISFLISLHFPSTNFCNHECTYIYI